MLEIIALINGLGEIEFIKVDEKDVEKFVSEKTDEGYLVSVITNGNVKKLASGEVIEFDVKENI